MILVWESFRVSIGEEDGGHDMNKADVDVAEERRRLLLLLLLLLFEYP